MAEQKKPLKKLNKKATKKSKAVLAKERAARRTSQICPCCGHEYQTQENNFYKSNSSMFDGNNGYVVYCKKCLNDMYAEFFEFYGSDDEAAMERMCQVIDMYYDPEVWEQARKYTNINNRLGSYMSKMRLSQNQMDGLTYNDTLINQYEKELAEEKDRKRMEGLLPVLPSKNTEESDEISDEVIRRFGNGFSKDDYRSLQYEYDDWVDKYGDPIDKRQKELYVSICYLKLNLQKSLTSTSPGLGSVANSYKAMIEAATTEIEERKKKEETAREEKPLGCWISDIENYAPAEFFKKKKLYEDFDHLKEYFQRFILRPMVNLLTGSKEMDKEFNISEEE